jgi:6-phosphogluconolactonase/glucosamine-6-phosphate isomerase/deaminase
MGADGHTASLFPGDVSLSEEERWALPVDRPDADPPLPRVTLTLPAINGAEEVLFLISGREKASQLANILDARFQASPLLPASLVCPRGGITWFVTRSFIQEVLL